jgi:O-antigen ligase
MPSPISGLIVLGVAAAGIDRVDLLAGGGPFVLTPFVLIAPLIIVAAISHWAVKGVDDKRPEYVRLGGWFVHFLCMVLLASLFFTETSRSVSRYILLLVLVAGGWALITLVRKTGKYGALRRGAWLGLLLYVGFDIIQWATFQGVLGLPELGGMLNMNTSAYGAGVIRMGGGSVDPNRAALAIATYTFILIGDPMVSKARGVLSSSFILFLGTALALATISRSGLAVFACVMIGAIAAIWRSQTALQKIGAFLASSAALVWVLQSGLVETLNVVDIAEARLSISSEGSAESHFELFGEAWGLVNANPISFFIGHGYGSSFLYLQDFFPGQEYANYHSMYLTLLVEAGVVSVLLICALLIPAALGGRRWLAIGTILFGVFYQGLSDPIFWIQIAMFWALPMGAGRVRLLPRTRPAPKPKKVYISRAYERMDPRLISRPRSPRD